MLSLKNITIVFVLGIISFGAVADSVFEKKIEVERNVFLTVRGMKHMTLLKYSNFFNKDVLPFVTENLPELKDEQTKKALFEAIKNSLDALRSRPNPTITLRINKGINSDVLTISDNGAGFPQLEDEEEMVLDKPLKSTKNILSVNSAGGMGFGMTQLLNTFSQLHDAKIRIKKSNGARIIIKIPKSNGNDLKRC